MSKAGWSLLASGSNFLRDAISLRMRFVKRMPKEMFLSYLAKTCFFQGRTISALYSRVLELAFFTSPTDVVSTLKQKLQTCPHNWKQLKMNSKRVLEKEKLFTVHEDSVVRSRNNSVTARSIQIETCLTSWGHSKKDS